MKPASATASTTVTITLALGVAASALALSGCGRQCACPPCSNRAVSIFADQNLVLSDTKSDSNLPIIVARVLLFRKKNAGSQAGAAMPSLSGGAPNPWLTNAIDMRAAKKLFKWPEFELSGYEAFVISSKGAKEKFSASAIVLADVDGSGAPRSRAWSELTVARMTNDEYRGQLQPPFPLEVTCSDGSALLVPSKSGSLNPIPGRSMGIPSFVQLTFSSGVALLGASVANLSSFAAGSAYACTPAPRDSSDVPPCYGEFAGAIVRAD